MDDDLDVNPGCQNFDFIFDAPIGGQRDQGQALLAASVLLPLAELPREKITVVHRHPDSYSIGSGFNSSAIPKASSAEVAVVTLELHEPRRPFQRVAPPCFLSFIGQPLPEYGRRITDSIYPRPIRPTLRIFLNLK